jgi:cytochrome c oxidase subunit IV
MVHDKPAPKHGHHPPYLLVFASLAILTLVEVGVTYVPQIPQAPVLMALSIFKALLVILFYMHVRYDSKWFGLIFLVPFALAVPLVFVLLRF